MNKYACIWLAAAMLTMLAAGGCDRAMTAYQRIPLEPPTRDDSLWDVMPPEAQECALGQAWSQTGRVPVPLGAWHRRVAFLEDGRGHRIAKTYRHAAVAWGILTGSMSYRVLLEVEVPPEWFIEPADDWQAKKEWGGSSFIASEIERQTSPAGHSAAGPKDVGSTAAALDFALRHFSPEPSPPGRATAGPRNVGRYVLASWLVMEGMHDNVNHHPAPELLSAVAERPAAFKGATGSSFDCRWRDDDPANGVYRRYRIRNMGGHRIQIEVVEDGLFFPTSYFGYGTAMVNAFGGYAPNGTRASW